MYQMSGSVDSALRLLDLADEGRFLLMSHAWRLDKWDESRERRALISYKARRRGEGKKLTWRDGVEALWILTRIRLRSGRQRAASLASM